MVNGGGGTGAKAGGLVMPAGHEGYGLGLLAGSKRCC
jgi:hypothetical protein